MSKKFRAEHSKALIGLSGCLKGEVAERLVEGKYDAARAAAGTYADIFGKENFYLEIQDQGLEMEHRIHAGLFQLEKDLGLPLVATNDSHYLCEDDSHAQDVMLCIQTGKSIRDTARMKFEGTQFFVKNYDEMYRVFKDSPEVLTRTLGIAERCHLKIEKIPNPFPQFEVPAGYIIDSYFVHVTREGFARRLDTLRPQHEQGKLKHSISDYEQRLERELGIIQQMKFPGYLLIVWDFIRYARERGIPVGPGRGSAAASVAAWCMKIADVDPVDFDLLFERFLNPERISMPDIDVDFCERRRGEVIDYVTRKYGRENVAQIITFGTMKAKAVIRDVGRVLEMPYADVDRIAKQIPPALDMTLDDAKTFKVFQEGAAFGIFQFESSGMRELLRKAKPTRIDDLIALNALYRPGPLKSGMVDDWVERKQGKREVKYDLKELEPILSETYGVIAYQEQVMRIAQAVAGFTLGQADVLRKAMGKKDPKVMAKQREAFLEGAKAKGVNEKKAVKLFELIEFFAGYGFNKSHSTAYAFLAYQTGYLKANYPWHFAAALLTIESPNTDKLALYLGECRDRGVPVLPPDINESQMRVTVEPET